MPDFYLEYINDRVIILPDNSNDIGRSKISIDELYTDFVKWFRYDQLPNRVNFVHHMMEHIGRTNGGCWNNISLVDADEDYYLINCETIL